MIFLEVSNVIVTTKTGDIGLTDIHNERIKKSSLLIDIIGQIDECISEICYHNSKFKMNEAEQTIMILSTIASILSKYCLPTSFDDAWISEIEQAIIDKEVTYNHFKFIYPLDNEEAALYNQLRTKIRKLERSLWKLNDENSIDKSYIIYINRLSDFYYLEMLRIVNK